MTKAGRLNKYDMETLGKALEILQWFHQWAENEGLDDHEVSGWQFDTAASAEASLRDFVESYEV